MNGSLRTEIEAEAGLVDVPPGDLDSVVRRGRHRRHRARWATASLTAMAVLAGGAVAVRAGGDEPPTTTFASAAGTAVLGDSGIEWTRADLDPTAALGSLGDPRNGVVEAGSGLYAISTAPGTQGDGQMTPRVLWRSDDGLTWSQTAGPDFSLDELTASADGRLYAVGTGPAAAGGDVDAAHFGWSDGDGWSDTELPLDTQSLAAGTRRVNIGTEDVAVGPAGIVVVARVGVELDVPALVPDGVSTEHGWAFIDGGVGILGDGEPCPETPRDKRDTSTTAADADAEPGPVWCSNADGNNVEPATIEQRLNWDDLGLDGDLRRAVERKPFVFHAPSTDGPFTRVDADFGGDLGADSTFVEAGDDGFDIVATSYATDGSDRSRLVSLRSPDGRTWTTGAGTESLTWVMAVGRVDGKLALVGYRHDAPNLQYAELDGGTWRLTDIGALIGENPGASAAAIGPLGVVVTGGHAGDGEGDMRTMLLASRDGRTWSVDDVEALAGEERIAVGGRILVRADRAVVSLGIVQPDGGPSRPIALVGTPR